MSTGANKLAPAWLRAVALMGRVTIRVVRRIGAMTVFIARVSAVSVPEVVRRFGLFIRQIYAIGVRTLVITAVAGFFVGMVLGLQGYHTLVKFNAEESLGVLVALSLLRELAPVISALLYAGRAGSALTSEIALMRATEQISAIEMMAVDPYRYIYAPRFAGGMVSLPILTVIFIFAGISGGYLIAVEFLGVDSGAFWGQMQQAVVWQVDLVQGLIKSVVFAFLINWIAIYEGANASPTAVGMSDATTRTVVSASLATLAFDFLITAFLI
ncbi:MAG: lipid asymmetry maintenance ABC transporter permease subunit MlaE [Gammaproteobacteria bacterium]|nr:lipid asymmetry maintenance ABC transporter permease subunit MlaE [Pseudomonadota bacterium]MCH9662465.1 lipid asymmetry maintenance ABC transporter permease subunit MlaE [Gammaproteobacteria bacterium]